MHMDSLMEVIIKLSIRCPVFAQQLVKHNNELFTLMQTYFLKTNTTLPVGGGKVRIFKEGIVRWNDVKFLN
jgi:hypothetical protein